VRQGDEADGQGNGGKMKSDDQHRETAKWNIRHGNVQRAQQRLRDLDDLETLGDSTNKKLKQAGQEFRSWSTESEIYQRKVLPIGYRQRAAFAGWDAQPMQGHGQRGPVVLHDDQAWLLFALAKGPPTHYTASVGLTSVSAQP
jgi:hypothetical protein